MADKVERIKQEIERRISNLEQIGDRKEIEIHFSEQFKFIKMYEGLLQFIDSLPEESGCKKKDYRERYKRIAQTEQFKSSYCDKSLGKEESGCEVNCTTKSEDLEEELGRILNKHYYFPDEYDELRSIPELAKYIAYHFAEWQKKKDVEEMMKTLIGGEIVKDIHNQLSVKSEPLNDTFGDIKFGDKVKVKIINKED